MRVIYGIGAVALALIYWVWITFFPERHIWHQKLMLVVETPSGEVSGYSVVEVGARFFDPPEFMTGNEVHYDLTGEAVTVEVLQGRFLFALMGDSEELFFWAAKDRFEGKTRGEWLRLIPDQTEPVTLTGDLIPMLVTFDDITKPETVRRVNPADLAAVFGEGVRLKSVTLEITEEAVTEVRVEGVLGWLCSYKNPYRRLSGKSGAIADNELSNRLGPGDFSIGECK